jgi:hypothetical protein
MVNELSLRSVEFQESKATSQSRIDLIKGFWRIIELHYTEYQSWGIEDGKANARVVYNLGRSMAEFTTLQSSIRSREKHERLHNTAA